MSDHSFIICAYKESAFLEECIQSLQNQTVNSEIQMITSTPNDYIEKLANQYHIPLAVNADGGIGQDWNFALKQARTKYVTLAHQDDLYFENYCEKILVKLNKFSDAQIVFSDYCEIRNNQKVVKNKNLSIKRMLLTPLRISNKSKWMKRRAISMGNAICCPAVTYNLRKIGDFKFHTNWKTNLDWDAWERLSRNDGRFVYIPEILMGHRIHEESETSNTIKNNDRSKEDLIMLEKFWPKSIAKKIFLGYTKSEESNQL